MTSLPPSAGAMPRLSTLSLLLSLLLPQALLATASQTTPASGVHDIPGATPAKAGARQLESVTVNAYRPADSAVGATKSTTPPLETPQSISVVTRAEMDARGVQSVNEAVRYIAGVQSEASGIDSRVDDYSVRGFAVGSFTNDITLDGMKAPGGSQWNRPSFDAWGLERVEVLKGPSAVLYGQVAPGGMVNQVSKLPTEQPIHLVQLSGGSFSQRGVAIDMGSKAAHDKLLYRVVGMYRDGNAQIGHTRLKRYMIAPSLTWKINDDTRLTLLSQFQRDQGGATFQFLPMTGTLKPGAQGYMRNTTFIGEPGWNTYNRTQYSAGWMFEHRFSDHWKLQQSLRYTYVSSLYRSVVTSGALAADGRTQNRRAVQGEGTSSGYTADTRLSGLFHTGQVRHEVLVGIDWQNTHWTGLRQLASKAPSSIDIYAPIYGGTGFASSLKPQVSTRETDQQLGFYAQDQLALGHWRLTLGTRYDWATTDALNRLKHLETPIQTHALTNRGGLLYLFDSGFAPYISFAQSFQPPTNGAGQSYEGRMFKAVTGSQYEAGVKYQPQSIDGMITAAVYDLRQRNILGTDPDASHVCGTGTCMIQDGEGRIRGIELEGRLTPADGWSMIGTWTRMQSVLLKSSYGNQGNGLPQVPREMASAWSDYTFQHGWLEGFAVAGGVRYISETWGDSANKIRVPAYTLFDASLRLDLARFGWRGARLAVNGSNLANKRYVATCGSVASCYYGSGRNLMATLRYQW
ncbi:TonB-dependent siderophore receptor [Frateuria aurantia]|uniref:TonB-dependent siderophore receptor n=1 Tax=Frateuria aurantia (strain ATCC 33424 / DSM 6220 / KCTC 2777 / LMG 1558 / NBRC 3245 / NCIMB 13370) TaxID=767434 RepID=H8L606_FRAAD|nr:TonB-dependent siderophore receptor [Frateuria aurantia]AFC86749.1 TonB-dependent siderophore receptor [Frateuria aurantia DSM 6220]